MLSDNNWPIRCHLKLFWAYLLVAVTWPKEYGQTICVGAGALLFWARPLVFPTLCQSLKKDLSGAQSQVLKGLGFPSFGMNWNWNARPQPKRQHCNVPQMNTGSKHKCYIYITFSTWCSIVWGVNGFLWLRYLVVYIVVGDICRSITGGGWFLWVSAISEMVQWKDSPYSPALNIITVLYTLIYNVDFIISKLHV